MTQKNDILEFLRSFPASTLITNAEIREQFGFPSASVRRITGSLVRDGRISRVEAGLFKIEPDDEPDTDKPPKGAIIDEFRRKFIGTQKYRGNPRQFFAITYENNDVDREVELIDALDRFLNKNYVDATGNTGYADDIVSPFEVERNFIYPSIQVGEL